MPRSKAPKGEDELEALLREAPKIMGIPAHDAAPPRPTNATVTISLPEEIIVWVMEQQRIGGLNKSATYASLLRRARTAIGDDKAKVNREQ